jgi:hypothetical protein
MCQQSLHYSIPTMFLAALILSTAGCSSQKILTPSSAREMLQQMRSGERDEGQFMLDDSEIEILTKKKVFEDYKLANTNEVSVPGSLRRLLDAGLVVQSVETHSIRTYPAISILQLNLATIPSRCRCNRGPWPSPESLMTYIQRRWTDSCMGVSEPFRVLWTSTGL